MSINQQSHSTLLDNVAREPLSRSLRKRRLFAGSSFLCGLVLLCQLTGCENNTSVSAKTLKTNFIDSSIVHHHSLGWTGAHSHPLLESASFANPSAPDETVSPGGLVITNVDADSLAAQSGLKTGDVIVGVGEEWLPVNDDPTLDFFAKLETRVAAGDPTSPLKVLREGKCESIELQNTKDSLDVGLPFDVARLNSAAEKSFKKLASMQNDDGSFGEGDSIDATLQTTALAGLGLLASDDDLYTPNVERCLEFIGSQIDKLIAESKANEEPADKAAPQKEASDDDKAPKGMMVMQPTVYEIDPLTYAYVVQFFAESKLSMMSKGWMPRMMGGMISISQSQNENGGWNTSEVEEREVDIVGCHTTNQVLLGLGMLERKGVMGNPEVFEKACGFLNEQISARSAGTIDRRVKAALMAGTGAALRAINCDQNDAVLKQATTEGLEQLAERHTSPMLTLPGALSGAILARQTGSEEWIQFHAATKYWLASVQKVDGSFQSIPIELDEASIEPTNEAWKTAHYCLLLSMQSGSLSTLLGETKMPMMVARDSSGKKTEGGNKPATAVGMEGFQPPPGAQVLNISLDDLEGDDIQEAIREKLKEQGIDIEGLEIQGMESLPGGEKKDDE